MATLSIDIGNRRAKLAIVSIEDEIVHRLHFPTSEVSKHSEEIEKIASDPRVSGIVIGSSVPKATDAMLDILSGHSPLIVTGETPCELTIDYIPLSSLGADRIAAAVGAFHFYGKALKQAIMIVDAGTAVTADLVDESGIFRGGAILPGDVLAFQSLANGTARLGKIEYRPVAIAAGTNTEECILVGVQASVIGAIELLYKRYGDLRGERPFMLLTGASSAWIAPELSVPHMVDPDIVLMGLRAIWTYNHGNDIDAKTSESV
ncbi:type III pantothenate kinase [bacterium]|nr:type III pantothenate kinase [bacterium]